MWVQKNLSNKADKTYTMHVKQHAQQEIINFNATKHKN